MNNKDDCQCPDNCQWTALMWACHFGEPAKVSRLVQEAGLDINYQDERGITAAYWASKQSQTECVRVLAETGRVDWNKRNKWGETPLFVALTRGDSDIVEIIVEQPNIDYNVKTEYGVTLAQAAVRFGGVKCVETLVALESFDCWNVPDSDGDTPIRMAIVENQTEILKILLRCPRVDPGVVSANGETAAIRATMQGEIECVRILAQTDRVDWNKTDNHGHTPLYWALLSGQSDIVDIIMQQPNIDYNVKNCASYTLGHAAVSGGYVKCVETLAAKESFDSWNVPDYQGNTAVKMALSIRTEMAEILLRCPRVNLDAVDTDMKHLEENYFIDDNDFIKNQLWTFRTVQQRMILRDSLLTRQAGSVLSLQSLSRDAVLLREMTLSDNSSQRVRLLVDMTPKEILKFL